MIRLVPFLLMPWRWYPWYRQPRPLGRRVAWRIGWILATAGAFIGFAFFYREAILLWFFAPAGDLLSPFEGHRPVFTEPTGMLTLVLRMSLYAGLLGAIPAAVIGFYHMAHSRLSLRMRLWAQGLGLTIVLLSIAAVMFVYYVILPNGVPFLLNFGGDVATAVVEVTAYMALALTLMFWMALFFQTPVLMFGATKFNIISYRRFKSIQKYVPWISLVLGAFITPGVDLVNALMVAGPLTGLYHVGLLASWAARPEEGNYLWLRTIGRDIAWLWHKVTAPYRALRWAIRKLRFW